MKDKLSKVYLILFLLLILSTLFSVDVYANENLYCSLEEIQNFEEAGYDEEQILYFKSDRIYYVYSYYDDQVYYDIGDSAFSIENNYMTLGYIENGARYVIGYTPYFSMYDYENSCILKVNENIPVKDKVDTYITDEGLRIVNSYSDCFDTSSNAVIGNICSLMIVSNNLINASYSSPVLAIMIGLFIISSISILIYVLSEVFKRL